MKGHNLPQRRSSNRLLAGDSMQWTQRLFLLTVGLCACSSSDAGDDEGRETGDVKAPDASTKVDASGMTRADSGRASDCPQARPAEETECSSSSARCDYDEIECRCVSGAWSCEEAVNPDCPATAPSDGSRCTLPEATECDFLQQECECLAGVWSCQSEDEEESDAGGAPDARVTRSDAGGGLDAGGSCPQARPAEQTTCTISTAACSYESTQCVCPNGRWSCSEPVDVGCPATTPLHGDPCSGIADCDFLEVECECVSGAWSCKAND
jgi:hypothetical protein